VVLLGKIVVTSQKQQERKERTKEVDEYLDKQSGWHYNNTR
jgi:hypothetical protein